MDTFAIQGQVSHVYPVDDLEKHELEDFDCKCNPKLERQIDGNWLVIHNSFDGREFDEEDNASIIN